MALLLLRPNQHSTEENQTTMAAKKTTKKKAPAKKAPAKKAPAKKAPAKKAAKKVAKKAAKKAAAKKAPKKKAAKKASFDEIAAEAYYIYRERVGKGLPGNPDSDWLAAEKKLSSCLEWRLAGAISAQCCIFAALICMEKSRWRNASNGGRNASLGCYGALWRAPLR